MPSIKLFKQKTDIKFTEKNSWQKNTTNYRTPDIPAAGSNEIMAFRQDQKYSPKQKVSQSKIEKIEIFNNFNMLIINNLLT